MIPVKIIRKPKQTGAQTASGLKNGAVGYAPGALADTARHALYADTAGHAGSAELAAQSNEARHAASAATLDADTPVLEWFLSKMKDDVAKGRITFEKGLEALTECALRSGATFGRFTAGFTSGTGARVDASGNAEFQSITVRSALKVAELIMNRIRAAEGDTVYSRAADTVESVAVMTADDKGRTRYRLVLRAKWQGYFTAFCEDDIVKGVINTLASGNGIYSTMFGWVSDVDTATNSIVLTMYPAAATPSGSNCAPVPGMVIVQRGNRTDTSRQQFSELSLNPIRLVHYTGVNTPEITPANWSTVNGELPDFLFDYKDNAGNALPLERGRGDIYAHTGIFQNLIRVDHLGKPLIEYIDKGEWAEGQVYHCDWYNTAAGRYETHEVWYNGLKYRCAVDGTTAAPGSADWQHLGGPHNGSAYTENIALKSDETFTASTYLLKNYTTAKALAKGRKYTATVWGSRPDAGGFQLTDNLGHTVANLQPAGAGCWSAIFAWDPSTAAAANIFALYNAYAFQNAEVTVERVKLEEGANVDPVWTPAAADLKGADGKDGQPGAKGDTGDKGDEGPRGLRGPAVRGPRTWEDIADGETLYSGNDGEEFLDVVLCGGTYCVCVTTHAKASGENPPTDSKWQQALQGWELVATNILLAKQALVRNLIAEGIQTKDENGNITFQALDGNLKCGSMNGQRVELDAPTKSVRIYGANGDECTRLDGSAYSSADLIPGGAFTLPAITATTFTATPAGGSTSAAATHIALPKHQISSPGLLKFRFNGTLLSSTPANPGQTAMATLVLYVRQYDTAGLFVKASSYIWTATNSPSSPVSADGITQISDFVVSVMLDKGYVQIDYKLDATLTAATARALSVSNLQLLSEQFFSRYFSNGFALTKDSENYLLALLEGGRMKLMLGGDSYANGVKQPQTVYAARFWYTNGAWSKTVLANSTTNPVTGTPSQTAAENVLFEIPEVLGANRDTAIVEVSGFGQSNGVPVCASITSWTSATKFTVCTHAGGEPAPGGFYIKISKF